jgi:hypothetical protein
VSVRPSVQCEMARCTYRLLSNVLILHLGLAFRIFNQQLIAVQERRPEQGRGHVLSWVGLGVQPYYCTYSQGKIIRFSIAPGDL